MNRSGKRQNSDQKSGPDVYAEIAGLSKRLITDMLIRMIESAENYRGWSLSDADGTRMVKLIKHKQRIICSSFTFQINKHFAEFKTGGKSPAQEKGARDWQVFGLAGLDGTTEIETLRGITERYKDAFKEFDRTILKRLQACIKRPRASIYENPLQVKRLCESFQYAIDSLSLAVNCKVALYQLFADRFIETLGPLYRHVDQVLLEHGMLDELPPARVHLRSIEGLSESNPPAGFAPDQSACLLMLLQTLKEMSRQSSSQYKNLFPELKQQFARYGLDKYDEQIDQLAMIFKLIFEDEDLPSPVKQQLSRLQIYVFITAIQEDGFLRRSTNPARRLLDSIIASEVEIAHTGHTEFSGVRFIREYIDGLARREFITIESYSEMLDGYQNFIKQNETATRNARRAEAARKVLPMVKNRLNEITQPLRVLDTSMILFEKVWLPLMVQIALQQGMDSDPWHKSIAMIKRQVWSLIPKSSEAEQQELLDALPQVAHSLHRAMRSLKLAESLQQSLRDYLKLQQQNVSDKTAQNIVEAKRRTRPLGAQAFDIDKVDTTEFDAMMQTGVFQVSPDMIETLNAVKPNKSKKIKLIETLGIGAWINMRQDGKSLLAKLAWKSQDSNLFIFVDRGGKRICEIDAENLEKKFESGEASTTDKAPVDEEKTRSSFMTSLH